MIVLYKSDLGDLWAGYPPQIHSEETWGDKLFIWERYKWWCVNNGKSLDHKEAEIFGLEL